MGKLAINNGIVLTGNMLVHFSVLPPYPATSPGSEFTLLQIRPWYNAMKCQPECEARAQKNHEDVLVDAVPLEHNGQYD